MRLPPGKDVGAGLGRDAQQFFGFLGDVGLVNAGEGLRWERHAGSMSLALAAIVDELNQRGAADGLFGGGGSHGVLPWLGLRFRGGNWRPAPARR